VKSPFTYQKIKLVVLSFIILAAVFFSPSVDPSHKSVIDALAPFEILADGFRDPMGVVIGSDGTIYVSDRKAGEVLEITTEEVYPVVTGLKRPVGLVFDPEGLLLIVEEKGGRLLRLEEDGYLSVLAKGIKKPQWVTVGEDKSIYISAKGLKRDRDRDSEEDEDIVIGLPCRSQCCVPVRGPNSFG